MLQLLSILLLVLNEAILTMTIFQTLLVADGDIPPPNLLTSLNYTTLLCLDGAATVLQRNKLEPHIILGDLDTLLKQNHNMEGIYSSFPQSEVIHSPNQNKTDLEKGLDYVLQKNGRATLCVGLFGKALDHTFYNLSVFARHSQNLPLTLLHVFEGQTQWGFILPKECCINTTPGSITSLSPITECTLSTTGLKWELDKTKLSPIGLQSVRNQTLSHRIKIKTQGSCLYLQLSEHPPILEF